MITLLATCAVVSLTIPPTREISFDRLIMAVEEVENGKWTSPGGRACWTPRTWAQYSELRYKYAQDRACSRDAMRHLFADVTARLIAEGITPTHWRLAMAWHRGYEGAIKARRTKDDYGERAAALAEEKR